MSPSPEANKTSQEPLTHAQSVQTWAGKLRDPSFTPTLDEFDALGMSARHIHLDVDGDRTTYTDIDGGQIKSPAAEAVLKAADESYWQETPDEIDISKAVVDSASPTELKRDNPKAYTAFETYCVRTGQPANLVSFRAFAETKQSRLNLQNDLSDRVESREAGATDPNHDRYIRSLAHLVTRVTAEDPTKPNQNLQAEMDTVNQKTKLTNSVTLTEAELARIEHLAPELEAGIKIKEKTEQEVADEDWLAKNRDEIIHMRRDSYILNGKTTPTKGWKPEDKVKNDKRGARFDRLTDEEKLGLKPLPNGEVMPPITIMLPEPEIKIYGATPTPPIKGGLAGFIPALTRHKGESTKEVLDVFGTALAGPGVRGVIAAVKYATGQQKREEEAEADARIAHLDALGKEAKAYHDAHEQRIKGIVSEMERAQELEKTVREIAQRRAAQDIKRTLSVRALNHVLGGRDPARELSSELRSYRLTVSDLLPGLDIDGDKRKKDKFKR